MTYRVCPCWLGFWLICPVHRYGQNPRDILAPYVRKGMTALARAGNGILHAGTGASRGSIRSSGRGGRSAEDDRAVEKPCGEGRACGRLEARVSSAESMGLADVQSSGNFTLAFAVVHEFPDAARFFAEVAAASKAGASLLLAEPGGHVRQAAFEAQLEAASQAGFAFIERPAIRRSHAALLERA